MQYRVYHHTDPQQTSSPPLVGSNHQDRVLLKSPRACELLLKYAGITRDRKKVQNPKQLTQMKTCSSISSFVSLVELINHLTTQTGKCTCPEPYREFLSEISRNSPACSLSAYHLFLFKVCTKFDQYPGHVITSTVSTSSSCSTHSRFCV
jgi:hypothetical protein